MKGAPRHGLQNPVTRWEHGNLPIYTTRPNAKVVVALSEARLPRDIAQGLHAAAHRILLTPSFARVNATVLVFLVIRSLTEVVSR